MKICKSLKIQVLIKGEDAIIPQGSMHWIYLFFKMRIVWPCTFTMAKSSNRSLRILLRSQLSICLKYEKYLFVTLLLAGMTHSIWKSWMFEQNVATENLFVLWCKVLFICYFCMFIRDLVSKELFLKLTSDADTHVVGRCDSSSFWF